MHLHLNRFSAMDSNWIVMANPITVSSWTMPRRLDTLLNRVCCSVRCKLCSNRSTTPILSALFCTPREILPKLFSVKDSPSVSIGAWLSWDQVNLSISCEQQQKTVREMTLKIQHYSCNGNSSHIEEFSFYTYNARLTKDLTYFCMHLQLYDFTPWTIFTFTRLGVRLIEVIKNAILRKIPDFSS